MLHIFDYVKKNFNAKSSNEDESKDEITDETHEASVNSSYQRLSVVNKTDQKDNSEDMSGKTTAANVAEDDDNEVDMEDDDDLNIDGLPHSVQGSLINVDANVYTVSTTDREYSACLKNLAWTYLKGDKVTLKGFVEENFGILGKFQVWSMEAQKVKEEYGRVTSIKPFYVVFEKKVVLMFSSLKDVPKFELNQEFKYVAIESDQKIDATNFQWRIVELLDNPIAAIQKVELENQIVIKDKYFRFAQSDTAVDKKSFVVIKNRSNLMLHLMKCKIDPAAPDLVQFESEGDGKTAIYQLQPNSGEYIVFLRIFPRRFGIHKFTFTANFATPDKKKKFQKKSRFEIEVLGMERNVSAPMKRRQIRFIDIRIKNYVIPSRMREIELTKVEPAIKELTEEFPFLIEPIDKSNYFEKMQFGLYLDELSLEMSFAKYCIKAGRFEDAGEFLRLQVKDVAEKRPSIIIGDTVEVTDPYRNDLNQPVYKGHIQKVENDAVLIRFHDDFHQIHHGKDYTINFNFSRTPLRNRHHALETVLASSGLGFQNLFPDLNAVGSRFMQIPVRLGAGKLKGCSDREHEWFDKKLNVYQKEAVVNILQGSARPMPYIIYGPPGTGKTLTVKELILQLFVLDKGSHLIIATPSNSAANLFTEELIKSDVCNKPHDFIRFVSNNQIEKELIPDYLRKFCGTISIESENGPRQENIYNDSDIRMNCTKSVIMNYRICIATLSCFGSLMQMKFPRDHFTHIIVDEAGQSTEPEVLIPFTMFTKSDNQPVTNGQIVLAGDPKQLGPICISRYAKTFGIDSSLLERLLDDNECYAATFGINKNEYDPRFVTKLKINYRSQPSVLKVYNELFYNSKLEGTIDEDVSSEAALLESLHAQDCLWQQPQTNAKCGVYFVDVVNGKNRKVPESSSWYNECEMKAIISILSKFQERVDFKYVGVITPYALQVKRLKHKISVGLTDTDLKIGTVEEFQGQERHIILVSTVRTEESLVNTDKKFGLGFLHCAKRMNVAISRARSLLIVFGKREILEKDERWKHLIDYTIEQGTFVVDERM